MSLSSTSQLAKLLADQTSETDEIKSNISPDDLNSSLPIFINERPIKITGSITVSSHSYGSTTFVIDHPVYGDIDSSTLAIDGDYAFAAVTVYTTTF